MTQDEILALPIEDILERDHSDDSIIIQFIIRGTLFYFHVTKIESGPFFPRGVYHSDFSKPCPFCRNNRNDIEQCEGLSTHHYTLFQRLTNSQSLRLHWLYREYLSDESQLSALPIKNIAEYQQPDKESYIYFTLNRFQYRLHVKPEADGFIPYSLFHEDHGCPLCGKNSLYCAVLSPHKQAFFQQLY